MNKENFYNIKIMNKGYGKTYHELQMIEKQHQRINGKLREEISKLEQENEELKKNQRYYKNGVFSLEYDKETLSDMVDDYKSRCEKAIEYINKHPVNACHELLNMLQNGSE